MKKLVTGKSTAGEEGMGPMDKGRYRYAKGDYAGALTAFTEVSTPQSCPCSNPKLLLYDDFQSSCRL
jgi:hypothetical protein